MAKSQTTLVMNALDEAVERVISSLAINITAELIEDTPVDTGWARANWVPSVGVPFEGNTDEIDREGRLAFAPAQSAKQQASTAAILSYRREQGRVFISNNVPYIIYLNEGSSDQAPSGFVTQSIVKGIRSLDSRRFA